MIDGEEQRAGASARSQVLACATSPEQVSFDGQLAPCYPPACGCRSLIRTLQLDRHAGVLQLIDQFHLHQACAVEVGTIVPAAVEAAGDGAQLLLGERHVTIRPLEGTHLVAIEPLRFTGHTGLPEQASRLVWKPLFVSLRPRIGIEIRSR